MFELPEFWKQNCKGYSEEDEWKGLISVCYGTDYRVNFCWHKHTLCQALQGFNESENSYLLPALREMRNTNSPVVFLMDSVARHSYISF
jgi:hypothetical protein